MNGGLGLYDESGYGFHLAHLKTWEQAFVINVLWVVTAWFEGELLELIWRGDWDDNRTLSIYALCGLLYVSISRWRIEVGIWHSKYGFQFRFDKRQFKSLDWYEEPDDIDDDVAKMRAAESAGEAYFHSNYD